ncbi:MAG: helix-turn-helix domain-containing protein [Gemmatimonadaceae bacterium]
MVGEKAALGLTQYQLARRLNSSQSRVAKMEAADRSVSVDLLLKDLFALGARPHDIGRTLRRAAA